MCCDYLDAFFPALTNSEFTSELEAKMDKIQEGKQDVFSTLSSFRDHLYEEVQKAKQGDVAPLFISEHKCKDCGESMIKKCGKGSVFLSCSTYPKCGYTVNFGEDGKIIEKEVQTGQACPKCGNLVLLKNGKFGQFYSCSASKEFCGYTAKVGQNGEMIEKKKEVSEHKCPNCDSGFFVKRAYMGKEFYGCSSYPACKTSAQIGQGGSPEGIKTQAGKDSGSKSAGAKGSKKKSDGETCTKCKTGVMVEKEGKFGKFMACDNYRNGCKNIKKV
jgi:DNA topoisomerase-1